MAKFKSARPREDEILQLPHPLENLIQKAIEAEGLRTTQSEKIAQAIIKQSNFYIEKLDFETPWSFDWSRIAQWTYYLPLNYLRAQRVLKKGQELNFFKSLDQFIELGPGLGAATLAISDIIHSGKAIEVDPAAIAGFKKTQTHFQQLKSVEIGHQLNPQPRDLSKTLGVFSYVLNELDALPSWALDCEALFIMEPATHQDGRKLLELRQQLIEKNFFIWAPCTHQSTCPLLQHSKKDWCHDRLHWDMPAWFKKIDRELPIKNNNLTMSYLLARKSPPEKVIHDKTHARVVGDTLHEKGKSRTLICRGEEREYLAWLHKKSIGLDLARGDLINLPESLELKGNELRF